MAEYGSVPHQPDIADREKGKLYGKRDVIAQGEFYLRHIHHMTVEDLYSKADIAAELAHRDARVAELEAKIEAAERVLSHSEYSDPEHVIHMHSKDLADTYRGLCAAVEKALVIVGRSPEEIDALFDRKELNDV